MGRLRQLIHEIHRRSLWQVLGIYVVASWGVLSIVDTLGGLLGLPEWFPAFALALLIVGLPIVLSTAFIQEGVSGRDPVDVDVIRHSAHGRPGAPSILFTWRNALGGGVLAFALWGVIAAGWLFFRADVRGGDPDGSPVTERSIAVLPFDNLMNDPEEQYFVDGMTEQLIMELAKVSGLTVISRTSTMRYRDSDKAIPQIAAELGVDAVVEGSVLRVGDRVRITVQLIDGSSDIHLWADGYDRSIDDVLAIHSEVARAVVDGVRVVLTPEDEERLARSASVNPEAYEAYLRGRFWWNRRSDEGFGNAIASFEQAIRLDQGYAPAYAGLADAHALLAYYGAVAPREGYAEAIRMATAALELDETLAEAHTSLGGALLFHEWEWSAAEREFKRAIELNPSYPTAHHWYSVLLSALGRSEEALVHIRRAQEVDPLSPIINRDVGKHYYFDGKYDLAEEALRQTLEIDSNFFLAQWYLGRVHEQRSQYDEAIQAFETSVALSGRSPIQLAALGHAYAGSGARDRAIEILAELEELSQSRYVDAHGIAELHMRLGDTDEAFRWFERAYEERSVYMIYLNVDPRYDELRSDPRFVEFLERLRLTG